MTVIPLPSENTRLTGPNDVVVKSDSSIWFSDNGAGIRGNYMGDKAPKEMPYRVYRLDPKSGALTIAVDDMERPNGLAFSPDEKKLYVVDTPDGPRSTRVYDVEGDKAVNGQLFFDGQRFADGIRVDTEGNVGPPSPAARARMAWRCSPDRTLIGRILLPERCANSASAAQAQPPVHDRQPVGLCALCRNVGVAGG